MTRGLPRAGFNSSSLIRFLAGLGVAEAADARQSFAERLGGWLDFTDAISLSAALNAKAAPAPAAGGDSVGEEFARLRRALTGSIAGDGVLAAGQAALAPAAGAGEAEVDFTPFHRYHLARQRDMEAGISPLRAKARAALAGRSPDLRRLAALDAVLEQALGPRERSLLATLPLLLEKRFAHLQREHRAALADGAAPDDPARWLQPGGWLAAFCRDLQGALLAELDLRLQPVLGLIEAFGNEVIEEQ